MEAHASFSLWTKLQPSLCWLDCFLSSLTTAQSSGEQHHRNFDTLAPFPFAIHKVGPSSTSYGLVGS